MKKLDDYLDKETLHFYYAFKFKNPNNMISAIYEELERAIVSKDNISEEQARRITEEILC